MSQTTEIQIQNQNGLSFRTKLNQMLSSLNTVFAGTTAPTTTEADMLWMDTSVSPNILKRRNSSNTAWEFCPIVEGEIHGSTGKSVPSNTDEFAIVDSASGNVLKKILWSEIKSELFKGGNLSGPFNANSGGTLASASTVNIGAATGEYITISGTTTITAFDTVQAGTMREVRFSGTLTLTHNATSLILPTNANITTAAGDCATFRSEGSGNWRCVKYQKVDGTALVGGQANQRMSLIATVATTSGTAIDFTSIPSWAKKITVMFSGVSTNGTSIAQIQLGSGTVQNSGYQAGAIRNVSNAANQAGSTSGFILTAAQSAADLFGGSMIISLLGSSTWVAQFALGYGSSYASTGGGSVTLTGTLDRIRLTTVNGTDTFDAGSVSLLIEGY